MARAVFAKKSSLRGPKAALKITNKDVVTGNRLQACQWTATQMTLTFEIVRAGLHCSLRMSRQMLP